MKKAIVIIIIMLVVITGCTKPNVENTLTGTVMEVNDKGFLMQTTDDSNTQYFVEINDDSVFEEGASKDLLINDSVKVEYTGEITESSPKRITARKIIKNK